MSKYITEECLQAYYDSLEEQLAEKDAIIDWLCNQLDDNTVFTAEDWLEMAQEAVKKNDNV